ncbi:hypothetical protein TPR58_15285 [Sphingomonas sp. HF-S3]|uniref:Lipoprotein n=1 Tax=Sphingomonas rustica TaxID=3103142 RepID=A0ABV0BAE4_9SPHN
MRPLIPLLALACTGCGSGGSVVVGNDTPVNAAAPALPLTAPAPAPAPVVPINATEAPADPGLNETELQTYPEARGLPADVQRYLIRHAGCEHWAGEEPYNAQRRAEIETNVAQSCTGLDAARADLLTRHRSEPASHEALSRLDPIGM